MSEALRKAARELIRAWDTGLPIVGAIDALRAALAAAEGRTQARKEFEAHAQLTIRQSFQWPDPPYDYMDVDVQRRFEAYVANRADSERVSVPREPTEAMMEAGDEAIIDGMQKAQLGIPYGLHPTHACWNVYRAMLAAAEKEKGS